MSVMALTRRAALLAAALLPFAAQAATKTGKRLLVLDFEILDTSQEPIDQRDAHSRRLANIRDEITAGLAAKNVYEIVDRSIVADDLAAILQRTYIRTCNGCELTLGRKANADLVMLGQVNKVSTLIMSMDVGIKRVATGERVYQQRFDFRGDNDNSWSRTAKFAFERIARDPVT